MHCVQVLMHSVRVSESIMHLIVSSQTYQIQEAVMWKPDRSAESIMKMFVRACIKLVSWVS